LTPVFVVVFVVVVVVVVEEDKLSVGSLMIDSKPET
jgi:hypothetical protein